MYSDEINFGSYKDYLGLEGHQGDLDFEDEKEEEKDAKEVKKEVT